MEVNQTMRLIVTVFGVLCCLVVSLTNIDAEIDPETAVGVWLFNETAVGLPMTPLKTAMMANLKVIRNG